MRTSYRADIDGLRALSVLAVLTFHYIATAAPGGFVGVDVFFVISGFLITGVLLKDVEEKRFSLLGFYDRRIRRLFPAMLVTLLVCLIAGDWLLLPGDYVDFGRSAIASAASYGNVYFLEHTGYFDQSASKQPLLHMWSLAVEEQFYIVWPLLLAGILALARGSSRVVITVLVALLLASFAVSCYEVSTAPKAAFFLPYSRAWELALGATLIFVPPLQLPRFVVEGLRTLGLALIAYAVFALTNQSPFPGANALFPCIGAALLIWTTLPTTLVSTILASPPLRFIGQISYSLYLWHWPVLVFYRYYNNGFAPTRMEAAGLTILSICVAALSWICIEQPFRQRMVGPKMTAAAGLISATAVALIAILVTIGSGFPERVPQQIYSMRSLEAMWQWKCPQSRKFDGLPGLPGDLRPADVLPGGYCVIGAPWETAKVRGILWGDSHAGHMAPFLDDKARANDASLIVYPVCAPEIHAPEMNLTFPYDPNYATECARRRKDALDFINSNPDLRLVVLSASWTGYYLHLYGGDPTDKSYDAGLALTGRDLDRLIPMISAPNREIVFIADVPQPGIDPVPCAIGELSQLVRRPCTEAQKMVSRTQFAKWQGPTYRMLAQTSKNWPRTIAVLPGEGMCNESQCMSWLDGEFLYRDASHLRRNLPAGVRQKLATIMGLDAIFAEGPQHARLAVRGILR